MDDERWMMRGGWYSSRSCNYLSDSSVQTINQPDGRCQSRGQFTNQQGLSDVRAEIRSKQPISLMWSLAGGIFCQHESQLSLSLSLSVYWASTVQTVCRQSVSQSVSQSHSLSVSHTVTQSLSQSFSQSVCPSVTQSVSQSYGPCTVQWAARHQPLPVSIKALGPMS